MTFTKACFIRKDTPELREKLKSLGYLFLDGDKRDGLIADRSGFVYSIYEKNVLNSTYNCGTKSNVLLDRIDKEGNIFLKILPLDKNLTLKLDECGRLYEKGSCVLFPTLYGVWEGFDPYATTIESPFEAGMVGYNEHLNEFGIISDDGSFMTNVDGSRITPIDRLATEVEMDI